jgi:hypothetical protein
MSAFGLPSSGLDVARDHADPYAPSRAVTDGGAHVFRSVGGHNLNLARAESSQVLDPMVYETVAKDRRCGEGTACGEVRNGWPARGANENGLHQ